MNIEAFKNAIREALSAVPRCRECQRMLDQGYQTQNPYWGQCAQATEAGFVLGQVLYGQEFSQRFKAYKNYVSGATSHYWLANFTEGQEQDVCDLTDHESDPVFDYTDRKLAGWINRKRSPDDIKKSNVKKIYDIAHEKLTREEDLNQP